MDKVYQNQVVYYGTLRGAISDIDENGESCNIHFEDGRYILNIITDVILKNAVWTITKEKLAYSELYKFVDESKNICSKYTAVIEDASGVEAIKCFLGENYSQVDQFIKSQGYKVVALRKSSDQLFKNVEPKTNCP